MFNNTPIYTAQGVDVTPFTDGCMTEGRVMLHDGCVDKPTPDNYTCEVQAHTPHTYMHTQQQNTHSTVYMAFSSSQHTPVM